MFQIHLEKRIDQVHLAVVVVVIEQILRLNELKEFVIFMSKVNEIDANC